MEKKIIFIDVDGTLCAPNGEVPESAANAIRRARRNGHQIFLCTGRAKPEILDEILAIGFDGVIGAGGGFVEIDGEVIHHQTMPEKDVREIVDYFDSHEIAYYLESNDGLFGSKNCKETIRKRVTNDYPEGSEEYLQADAEFHWFYELLDKFKDKEVDYGYVNKISFISGPDHPFAWINDRFKDKFEIYRTTVAQFGPESGEIAVRGVDKATAIEIVLDRLGVERKNTMVYGDGNNDLKMFEAVEYGVAMENATDELKRAAKEIKDRAEDNGILKSFVTNGLI